MKYPSQHNASQQRQATGNHFGVSGDLALQDQELRVVHAAEATT